MLEDGTYIPEGEVREVIINGKRYRCVGCGGCTPIEERPVHSPAEYPAEARTECTPIEERPVPSEPAAPILPSPPSYGNFTPSYGGYRPGAIEQRKREKEAQRLVVDYNFFRQQLRVAASGTPDEHTYLRDILEKGKYAHMSSAELAQLAQRYKDDKEIQEGIRRLQAYQKAMEALEKQVEAYLAAHTQFSTSREQAKREVLRALAEVASIKIPGADNIDEWLSREITLKELGEAVVKDAVGSFITSTLGDLKLEGKSNNLQKTLGYLKKAVAVYELYSIIDKTAKALSAAGVAWDKYAEAVEMREYVRALEGGEKAVVKWFEIRNKALAESEKLHAIMRRKGYER